MYLARLASSARLGKKTAKENKKSSSKFIQSSSKGNSIINGNSGGSELDKNVKTIEKLLDEASCSGELSLSGKKLKEFPRVLQTCDLSDTLIVDLSRNQLNEFPIEICLYMSLETLNLYSNIIRSIPDNVSNLRCLKLLDLNRNSLCYLPPSICNLVSLEVLTVNNNKLVSLPEEIFKLEKLIQLDVSCNEITHLPVQIGDMKSLRALNVRRNLLVELPNEISSCKLVSFDCSCNRITKLPLCFREIITLIDLNVDHNPLEIPPASLCTKGLLHIMKYLLNETIKEEKKRGVLTEYEISRQYRNSITYQSSRKLSSISKLKRKTVSSLDSGYNTNSDISIKQCISQTSPNSSGYNLNSINSLSDLTLNDINQLQTQTQNSTIINNDCLDNNLDNKQNNSHELKLKDIERTQTRELSKKMHEEQLALLEKQREENKKRLQQISKNNENTKQQSHHTRRLTAECGYYERNDDTSPNNNESKHRQFEKRLYNSSNSLRTTTGFGLHNETIVTNSTIPLSSSSSSYECSQSINSSENANRFDNGGGSRVNDDLITNSANSDCSSPDNASQHKFTQQTTGFSASENNANISPKNILPKSSPISNFTLCNGKELPDLSQINPAFTIRRHIYQVQEEYKQIELLKKCIETKLKITLPDDIATALADGVVLCHLMNQMFPRAVQIIHVPSLAVPKLSLAKCRKNVENFIEACHRIGLPENETCCSQDIIECKHTPKVARTIVMLVNYHQQQFLSNDQTKSLINNIQQTTPKQEQQTAV